MRTLYLCITVLIATVAVCRADVVVHTSDELRALLIQDADLGTVWLDGDVYEVDGLVVRAGGVIKPYGERKPCFVGKRVALPGSGIATGMTAAQDFVVTNAALAACPVSQQVVSIQARQIEKRDSVTRRIRIDMQGQMPINLRNKAVSELSMCTLKLSFWFLCMNVTDLSADERYLYGTLDTDYNYGKLGAPYSDFATLCLYNVPGLGDGIYVDGRGVAHFPSDMGQLTLHLCSDGLVLDGKRHLVIEGVTFVGLSQAVTIKTVTAVNKEIRSCTFMHCNKGVICNNGLRNVKAGISVTHCTFKDMYGSECILLYGCDNSLVAYNTTHRTGLLNKGGSVISVAGDSVCVCDNRLSAFSYNGIRMGHTRLSDRVRISGTVERNYMDNSELYGHRERYLTDGGAIYIYTHQDATVIRDNVVCNVGGVDCDLRGIFMDDGAYNTTVAGNLVFNIMDSYCIDSRMVGTIERHNGNNNFDNNVCIGECRVHGHTGSVMDATTVSDNYVSGRVDTTKGNVVVKGKLNLNVTPREHCVVVNKKTYRRLKRILAPFVMEFVKK